MKRKLVSLASVSVLCAALAACEQKYVPADSASSAGGSETSRKILFDDFSYANADAMFANNWRARTETGHPGVAGATWSAGGITFLQDSAQPENTLLRMTSSTDGSGENTNHTQFCHQRKYLEGTYAARVFFRNEPTQGPDGDQIIETFYTISPLKKSMDPDYSEMDFEYLANGGWGEDYHGLFATSWETFKLNPFVKDNEYTVKQGSFEGWHTLVLQVSNKRIRYFVDGEQFAEHSEHVYPEAPMSINFNLWFTQEGLVESDENRVYQQDVDWVYHNANEILNTGDVIESVAKLRDAKIKFTDTVPDWNPKLDSPCGL